MQVFKSPKNSLGDLGAQSAARMIAAATDIALVVDAQGVVKDVAFNKDELSLELDGHGRWLGSHLVDIVTSETRGKVTALLNEAPTKPSSAWRQVNHPSPGGEDVPVLYSAINIGRDDRFVVVGRDLRPLASMQQRLIAAQQSMERDYAKLRHAETRYRLLFQVSSEAVMIVDASSFVILDVNPAALAVLEESATDVVKSQLMSHFQSDEMRALENLLADVRATGRDANLKSRTKKSKCDCSVAVSLFRQENASLFLVRLLVEGPPLQPIARQTSAPVVRMFEDSPDGMVIARPDGRIVRANDAFLEIAQLSNEDQARGELLDRWIGRVGVDFGVAMANLRQSGSLKLFSTVLRGELGAISEIEMSAVSLSVDEGESFIGLSIRNIDKRLSSPSSAQRKLPRSVAQLTEMIGRVPLKDIVRETTDVIEKLSIEAALELTGDNRASAAEMLGLSRQSLYVKLRRFGLAESTPDEAEHE